MTETNKGKVAIFGGTGFIGSFITEELLVKGLSVTCLSKDDNIERNHYIKGADFIYTDLYNISEEELVDILRGFDSFIFAAGADDRYIPPKPAIDFFRKANVENTLKVVKAGKKAGLKKGIIITSYFAYFARKYPEWKLTEYHPYIKSRIEQEDAALREVDGNFSIVILQLPYVIGAMKNRPPLFKPLVKYLYNPLPIFFMKGGTAVISVKEIAKATYNFLNQTATDNIYSLVSKNYTWDEFIQEINPKKKLILHIPHFLLKIFGHLVDLFHTIAGKEGGLKISKFIEMQTKKLFLDEENIQPFLKGEEHTLKTAFEEMVFESLQNRK